MTWKNKYEQKETLVLMMKVYFEKLNSEQKFKERKVYKGEENGPKIRKV